MRNPQRDRDAQIKSKRRTRYGLSPNEFDRLTEAQGGGCAVCGSPESGERNLSVDHNHETGEVRGILCRNCNTGLGCFGDSPELMLEAIAYLRIR